MTKRSTMVGPDVQRADDLKHLRLGIHAPFAHNFSVIALGDSRSSRLSVVAGASLGARGSAGRHP
jgi:hypothetical protein